MLTTEFIGFQRNISPVKTVPTDCKSTLPTNDDTTSCPGTSHTMNVPTASSTSIQTRAPVLESLTLEDDVSATPEDANDFYFVKLCLICGGDFKKRKNLEYRTVRYFTLFAITSNKVVNLNSCCQNYKT